MRSRLLPGLCLLLLLGAAGAHATDGVLEINQECAVASGCFPGDAPGYPVTIDAQYVPARSFRLTSDLGPLAANQTGIVVSANNATIDLNGFRIYGTTSCSVVPVTCSPLGVGVGISGGSDVTVKNGTIHGMGDDGVRLLYSCRVENVHAFHNGADGIDVGNESLVRGNVVTSNRLDGIRCGLNCEVRENTSTGNGAHGIEMTSGAVVGNTAGNNGARGAQLGSLALAASNVFASNVAPDLSGGHAVGGNLCSDGSCTSHGERRYYLSKNTVDGSGASTACVAGYHLASLYEFLNLTVLRYDRQNGYTKGDSGAGPPTFTTGWVRTGNDATTNAAVGEDNCNAWTTADPLSQGSWVRLDAAWQDGNTGVLATDTPPWQPGHRSCAVTDRAWCVED